MKIEIDISEEKTFDSLNYIATGFSKSAFGSTPEEATINLMTELYIEQQKLYFQFQDALLDLKYKLKSELQYAKREWDNGYREYLKERFKTLKEIYDNNLIIRNNYIQACERKKIDIIKKGN